MGKVELFIKRACIKDGTCRSVPINLLNSRMYWAKRYQWKKAWQDEVWVAMLQAKVKQGQFRTIKITLKTVSPMDKDNSYGSVKDIVDQLTGGKDKQSDIALEVVTKKVSHKPEQGVLIAFS